MKAVVVGGTGFLGLNLVAELRDAGHDLRATRRRSSNTIFARRMKVPLVSVNMEAGEGEDDGLTEAFEGRELVYFCAGHYPRYSVDTEAQVALSLGVLRRALSAAKAAGVRRFVYVGSVATVGRAPGSALATEGCGEAVIEPGSTYTAIKLALEREALAANGSLTPSGESFEVVSLLPTGLLGPYDHKIGTGYFLIGLLAGKLDFFLDGQVNFIDARDAARAMIVAATAPVAGQRVILGGHNLSVREYVKKICEQFSVAPPARELKLADALALATSEEARCLNEGKGRPAISREMVDAISHGQFVDCSLAQDVLHLAPRPLEETIEDAATWYRRNGFLPNEGKGDSHERSQAGASEQRL